MTIAFRNEEMLRMVDPDTGTVDRRIFSDRDIYDLEMERIFARAWNFMAHESQIPNPGDFFMTFIGEDRVIVVRDNDGNPQVLVNTCRHRGNAICRAEGGHATSFMCTYHGWTYDLKGALVGVPGFKEVYHEELDRENWGLIKAGQVESFKGFIFANMDPEAPALEEYLGEVGRLCLELTAARGNLRITGGIQKFNIPCNWKFAVDNVWDFYHPQVTHASAFMSGVRIRNQNVTPGNSESLMNDHVVLLAEYGHALSGPIVNQETRKQLALTVIDNESWRDSPEAQREFGPVKIKAQNHPHIFPNMWLTSPGSGQVSLRLPKGPAKTEIWWFSLTNSDLPADTQRQQVDRAIHVFGPAGMLEQEDGENWGQSTRGTLGTASKGAALNYAMNLGHGEINEDESSPPWIDTHVNEHAQLWHYRAWADWMAADSWLNLKANHTAVPQGRV